MESTRGTDTNVAAAEAKGARAAYLCTLARSITDDIVSKGIIMRDAIQNRMQEAAIWRTTVCPPREAMAVRAEMAAGACCCEVEDYVQAFDLFVGVQENPKSEASVRGLAFRNIQNFFDHVRPTDSKREWGAPPSAADIEEMRRIIPE